MRFIVVVKNLTFCIMAILYSCEVLAVKTDEAIDQFILSKMSSRDIPGLQLAIVQNGEIVKATSYGIANIEDSVAVDNNTVFAINSMTKAFTGIAIMQLVEEGKIDLTARVSSFLPDLPKDWRSITISQLLSHTSGLPSILIDKTTKMISPAGSEASWNLVQNLAMEFPSGHQFRYNQVNYILLGKIIEANSGIPFTDYINNNQLKNINMKRTAESGFGHYQDIISHSARGYSVIDTDKMIHANEEFPPFMRTAAGMSSTATEMAQWLIGLQSGKLLKQKESLKTLWNPAVLHNGETAGFGRLINGYAMGWPVVVRPKYSALAPIGGGRSALFVYPNDNLSIIVLTNLQGAFPEYFIDEIAGFFYPDMKAINGFGLVPEIKALRTLLEKKGYTTSIAAAQEIQKQQGLKFKESGLNRWGYQLIDFGSTRKALEIFRLNVFLFPNSANAYDSLGETFAALNINDKAIENYQKSVDLDPENQHAKNVLKTLRMN